MIPRLAFRSLATRPLRTLILSVGFGLGIAVMAILLGVGEVVLQQARSPALQGGGDLVVTGASGGVDNARFVAGQVLSAGEISPQVVAASPWKQSSLYLVGPGRTWRVSARGGVPSLEAAIGDREISNQPAWIDEPRDKAWTTAGAGDVIRSMDRFHPIPNVPEFAGSWAEWLYFNGRTADGRMNFYLTFMVGPLTARGRRAAGVRLQLERDHVLENFSASGDVDERRVLEHAPDLDIAGNHVRLDGSQYSIALQLRAGVGAGSLTGAFTLDASGGRSLPPFVMRGARGWLSGYTVPVLSGAIHGTLDGRPVTMAGYHDHNWGFWEGVRWQWGQVAHEDLSFVYGRVFPPPTVVDPARVPGFLGVLGPDGVIGIATHVSIAEHEATGVDTDTPRDVDVTAKGNDVDVRLRFAVDQSIRTNFGLTGTTGPASFLQLAGVYRVTGRAGERQFDFSNRGAAETFR